MKIFQRSTLIILVSLFSVILLSRPSSAQRCFDIPGAFQENRSIFSGEAEDRRILILPFINETHDPNLQWLSDAYRLGLFLMLEHGQTSDVIETRPTQTSFEKEDAIQLGAAAGADYVITGQYRKGQGTLKVFYRFVEVKGEKNHPIEEAKMEWPNTKKYAELMVHIARRASKAFKDVRVDKKQLKRIENHPRTARALQYWTLAQIADRKGTKEQIQLAHDYYQEAIKNDFNYCYGYIGLGQTLAEIGFMLKERKKAYQKYLRSAERELSKVLLLCPDIAELWGKRITQYLEADALETVGQDRLNKGDLQEAIEALERATALLPGDRSIHQLLVQAYRQQGNATRASEEQVMIRRLSECH